MPQRFDRIPRIGSMPSCQTGAIRAKANPDETQYAGNHSTSRRGELALPVIQATANLTQATISVRLKTMSRNPGVTLAAGDGTGREVMPELRWTG